jgi:hypothetical protein
MNNKKYIYFMANKRKELDLLHGFRRELDNPHTLNERNHYRLMIRKAIKELFTAEERNYVYYWYKNCY